MCPHSESHSPPRRTIPPGRPRRRKHTVAIPPKPRPLFRVRGFEQLYRARRPGRGTRDEQRVQPSHRRSEEHTSELQSHHDLVCRLLLEKKKKQQPKIYTKKIKKKKQKN